MDEIVQREDHNVDEQKVSNLKSWHWLEKDINIDIRSVCPNAKWTVESVVKIYLKECFRKVWLKFISVIALSEIHISTCMIVGGNHKNVLISQKLGS